MKNFLHGWITFAYICMVFKVWSIINKWVACIVLNSILKRTWEDIWRSELSKIVLDLWIFIIFPQKPLNFFYRSILKKFYSLENQILPFLVINREKNHTYLDLFFNIFKNFHHQTGENKRYLKKFYSQFFHHNFIGCDFLKKGTNFLVKFYFS